MLMVLLLLMIMMMARCFWGADGDDLYIFHEPEGSYDDGHDDDDDDDGRVKTYTNINSHGYHSNCLAHMMTITASVPVAI